MGCPMPADPMPAEEDLSIAAADGFALSARLFAHEGDARGSVLMNPATGVRKEYYQPFAEFLAARGWRVVTFDNRGVGNSRPASLRGFAARMQDWAELDAEGALRWMIDDAAGSDTPLCLVGHSFGGQALGLVPTARRLDAALLVATQSGYWGHWPWWQRPRVMALWFFVIPLVTAALGYFPARRFGLGEDLPAGVARQWARWGRHPEYLMRDGSPSWRRGYESLALPIRGIGFADDTYAPQPSMAAILALYANARVEHRHLAPRDLGVERVGHFGFFRERHREILWEPAAAWLESHWVSSREDSGS
jgi:predicted alpha/beta hydrolase